MPQRARVLFASAGDVFAYGGDCFGGGAVAHRPGGAGQGGDADALLGGDLGPWFPGLLVRGDGGEGGGGVGGAGPRPPRSGAGLAAARASTAGGWRSGRFSTLADTPMRSVRAATQLSRVQVSRKLDW